MHLQEGQRITAPFLAGTAEVKRFEPRTGYYRLEVVLQDGNQTYKSLQITEQQLAQIRIVERSPVALTGNAEDFFFLIEAHRIRLAYQFDPQLAVSVSQIDPLPLKKFRYRGIVERAGGHPGQSDRPVAAGNAKSVQQRVHRLQPRYAGRTLRRERLGSAAPVRHLRVFGQAG
jgi:hypothetical protein